MSWGEKGMNPWFEVREGQLGTRLVLGPKNRIYRLQIPKGSVEVDFLKKVEKLLNPKGIRLNPKKAKPKWVVQAFSKKYRAVIVPNGFVDEAKIIEKLMVRSSGDINWKIGTVHDSADYFLFLSRWEIQELTNEMKAVLQRQSKIIIFGETQEGLHLGPVVSNDKQFELYRLQSQQWSMVSRISELGFSNGVVHSLFFHIRHSRDAVRQALGSVHSLKKGIECILVEPMRKVELPYGTEFALRGICWGKGIIRGLKVYKCKNSHETFLGEARSPAGGIGYLESNSGKGYTPNEARMSAIGEAIERFSAWNYNKKKSAPINAQLCRYELDEFHPYSDGGRKTVSHWKTSEWDIGYDFTSGTEVRVPRALIPFPFESEKEDADLPISVSTGLAAYKTTDGAVLRGFLELIEKQNLYVNFLWQSPFHKIKPRSSKIAKVKASIEKEGGRLWFLVFPDSIEVPVVHVFYLDSKGRLSRGSGTGLSSQIAAEKALLEAIQISRQHDLEDKKNKGRDRIYSNWSDPISVQKIVRYLDAEFPESVPQAREFVSDGQMLQFLFNYFKERAIPVIAVDLMCPIKDWFAVRVLIPSFTINQFASHSAGGARLIGAPFKLGIPT